MRRTLTPFEKVYVDYNICMQLGLKVKDSSLIEPILHKLSNCVLGLHSRVEGDKLITEKRKEIPVFTIPEFKNLNKACNYVSKKHQIPFDYSLASVGVNKDTIILSCNHLAADGKFTNILFDTLKNDSEIVVPNRITDCDSVFAEEIKSATDLPPFMSNDPTLCRIQVKDKLHRTNSLKMSHFPNCSQATNLQVYDKETGQIHGLSDSFWSNIVLSICAYNNDFSKRALANCCDMRPFMDSYDYGITNAFADLTIDAQKITKDSTIKEMMRCVREDFKKKYNKKHLCAYLRTMQVNTESADFPGIAPELSSIGRFQLGGPFTDVWVNCTMSSKLIPKNVPILAFSIDGLGKNEMHTIMRYNKESISKNEISTISKSIHYGMESIPLSTTVGEALDILQNFQQEHEKMYPKIKMIQCE